MGFQKKYSNFKFKMEVSNERVPMETGEPEN